MSLPSRQALLTATLGGFLLLPSSTRFKLSGFPDLDKAAMIAIGVLLGTLLLARTSVKRGGNALFFGVGAVFVLSPFATAYFNPDPIVGHRLFFPGLTWYDGLSNAAINLFFLVPFWAGRRLLADEAGHRAILQATVVAILGYSLLILLEIRLSPQLHRWVYGFFPPAFDQQFRAGGFRAVVFLTHGLVVATFVGLGLLAALALRKPRSLTFGVSKGWWAVYLVVIMILQKSLGAAVTAFLLGGVMLTLSPRRQVGLAAILAGLVAVYPMVRGAELLPITTIKNTVSVFSTERNYSLNVRLENEEALLAKASERPMFGWGSWGRNRVYDLDRGVDQSTTDGTWIMVMGSFGWVGYLSTFGLLTVPLFRLRSIVRRAGTVSPATAGVAMMLIYNLCDLIPNSSLTPFTWLMAGSLLSARNSLAPRSAALAPPQATDVLAAAAEGPVPARAIGQEPAAT